MAQQGSIEDLSQGGVGIYKALSVVLIFTTILYINLTSTARAVAKFPLIGQSLGGYTKRRAYFATQALELFREGYSKVANNVLYRISTMLMVRSSRILYGVSLHPMVRKQWLVVISVLVLNCLRRGTRTSPSIRRRTARKARERREQ